MSIKERPILFSGSMIRAILDGRKIQTRRLVKPQPDDTKDKYASQALVECLRFYQDGKNHGCKHGKRGDQIWVKETWRTLSPWNDRKPSNLGHALPIEFAADGPPKQCKGKLRPSIFMPRWASRITLEIVGVRVERLQDISEADAKAEGADAPTGRNGTYPCPWGNAKAGPTTYVESYRKLWESINGKGSWALNPFVWVIQFKKL